MYIKVKITGEKIFPKSNPNLSQISLKNSKSLGLTKVKIQRITEKTKK